MQFWYLSNWRILLVIVCSNTTCLYNQTYQAICVLLLIPDRLAQQTSQASRASTSIKVANLVSFAQPGNFCIFCTCRHSAERNCAVLAAGLAHQQPLLADQRLDFMRLPWLAHWRHLAEVLGTNTRHFQDMQRVYCFELVMGNSY